jgi:hypothetical protein
VFVLGTAAGAISAVAFRSAEEMATWKRARQSARGAWLAMFPLGFRLFE